MKIDEQDILVSYDVSSLFMNVPVDETIEILAEKAFKDDWFNKKYNLNITKTDLVELLEIATKNQVFQFEGNLYEQVDETRCLLSISDMSMTLSAKCPMFHLPLNPC